MHFIIIRRNGWIYRLISPLTQNTCWPPEQARNWLDGAQWVLRRWSSFLLGAEGTWEQEKHAWVSDRTSAHEMRYFGQLLVLTHYLSYPDSTPFSQNLSLFFCFYWQLKGRPSWGKEEQKSVSQQKNHQRNLELPLAVDAKDVRCWFALFYYLWVCLLFVMMTIFSYCI